MVSLFCGFGLDLDLGLGLSLGIDTRFMVDGRW